MFVLERTPLLTINKEIHFPSVLRGKGCPSDLRKMRLDGAWSVVTVGLTFSMNTSMRKAVSAFKARGAWPSSSRLCNATSMTLVRFSESHFALE